MPVNQSGETGVLGGGLAWLMLPMSVMLWAVAPAAIAQIMPDDTLGAESSHVRRGVEVRGGRADRIDGGAIRAGNLFHSFSEFNVNELQRVYFSNPTGIENILSRVTGNDVSDILGTLGVDGNANLFLLNPNGIIFGPNARLDVTGSFVATTADRFAFDDGSVFSAIEPDGPPLLEVSLSVGLQYGDGRSGAIINAGDLAVGAGENLTLAGETVINAGTLTAPGGEVAITSIPSASTGTTNVQLNTSGQIVEITSLADLQLPDNADAPSVPEIVASTDADLGLTLTDTGEVAIASSNTVIPTESGDTMVVGVLDASSLSPAQMGGRVQVLGDRVALVDSAQINVSGNAGGGVALIGGDYQGQGSVLNAQRTYISPDSIITADAITTGNGGRVITWADGITGFYGTINARGGKESGDGGFVEVSGLQNLTFDGYVDVSAANGTVGTLLLDPIDIIIANGSGAIDDNQLDANTPTDGDPLGQILGGEAGATFTISENKLESLDGAASVILQATNNITLQDLTDDALTFQLGGGAIAFRADFDGVGGGSFIMNAGDSIQTNGRNLTIAGSNLELGSIRSSNSADPTTPAGTINLTATAGNITAGQITSANFVTTGNVGNGGTVDLRAEAGSITVSRGIFSASHTLDGAGLAGNAGDVRLSALNDITVQGATLPVAIGGRFTARHENISIEASTPARADYAGGDVEIISTMGNISLPGSVVADGNPGGVVNLRATNGSVTVGRGILSRAGSIFIRSRNDIRVGDTNPFGSFNTSVLENVPGTGTSTGQIDVSSTNGSIIVSTGLFTNSQNDGGNAGTSGSIRLEAADRIETGLSRDFSVIRRFADRFGVQTASLSSNGISSTSGSITLLAGNNITVGSPGFFPGNDPGGNGSVSAESLGGLGAGNTGAITIRSTNGSINLETGAATSSSSTNGNAGNSGDIELTAGQDINIGSRPGTLNFDRRGVRTTTRSNLGSTGTAGAITIDAGNNLTIVNGAVSSEVTGLTGTGNAGDITLEVSNQLTLPNLFNQIDISSVANGTGNGGDIILISQTPITLDNRQISSGTRGSGAGGAIRIEAPALTLLNRADLVSDTRGSGSAGSVIIRVPNSTSGTGIVSLAGGSNITTRSRLDATGRGGTVDIEATQLRLQGGSFIDVGTSGTGPLAQGGDVELTTAGGILLEGNSRITADTEFGGAGGTITIASQFLSLQGDSSLDASVRGSGAGGDINIITRGSNAFTTRMDTGAIAPPGTPNTQIENFGVFLDNSTISTIVEPGATGTGGNVNISTEAIALRNGSSIQTRTRGGGDAGNVALTTQRLLDIRGTNALGFNSGIAASSETPVSGAGGNITINSSAAPRGTVTLSDNGFLSALTRSNTANAGNIEVNAENLTLQRGGQILTASTTAASAGSITVNAATQVQISGQGTAVTSTSPFAGTNTPTPLIFGTTADAGLQEVFDGALFASRPNQAGTGTFAYFSFQVIEANSRGVFDIDNGFTDGGTTSLDTELFLFNQRTGALLASSDDASTTLGQGGSVSSLDSFVDFTFADPGDYVIGVGRFNSSGSDGTLISGAAPLRGQSYDLRVSLQNAADGVASVREQNPNPNLGLRSGLFAEATNGGNAGDVTVTTPTLTVQNGARISTNIAGNNADATAGSVTINARTVNLSGSSSGLFSETRGAGDAGDLILQPDVGNDLIVDFQNGAQISASTQGAGAGGDLILGNLDDFPDGLQKIILRGQGSIVVEAVGAGDAGTLQINTRRFSLANGVILSAESITSFGGNVFFSNLDNFVLNNSRITASTAGGNAGGIIIQARESIRLSGTVEENGVTLPAGLFVEGGTGQGGFLVLSSPTVTLEGGAQATASTTAGLGGVVTIEADSLTVQSQANQRTETGIFASTQTGEGGDVVIGDATPVSNLLVDGARSRISAEATETGDSGTITITGLSITVQNDARVTTENISGSSIVTDDASATPPGISLLGVNQLVVRDGGQVLTETDVGTAGTLTIDAGGGSVELMGTTSRLSAQANVAGGRAGDVNVMTRSLLISDGASLSASNVESSQGGNVGIRGLDALRITGGGQITADTQRGNAGNVRVTGPETTRGGDRPVNSIFVSGENSQIAAEARLEGGNAGNVQFYVRDLRVRDGGEITTSTRTGEAGNIRINTDEGDRPADSIQVSGDGSRIAAEATGGNAGRVRLNVRDLTVRDDGQVTASNRSGTSDAVILSNLNTLEVVAGGSITASTRTGEAGDVVVNRGDRPVDTILIRDSGSRIAAEAIGAEGNAGGVELNVRQLTVREDGAITASNQSGVSREVSISNLNTLNVLSGGSISASTESGTAGSVTIAAGDTITVRGENSRIEVEAGRGGVAGDLRLSSRELQVREGGLVSVSSPEGQAGSLAITSPTIFLNTGRLTAITGSTPGESEGANITLEGLRFLLMENDSLISARALNDATGGNITINSAATAGGFIIAPVFNNSDIIATAEQGQGGAINIFVDQLFGFTLQDDPTGLENNLTNDISASSAGGPQGVVNLNTLNVDPSRGLGELPLALVSAPPLDAVCVAQRDESQSSFVVAGREGLPSSPAELGSAQPIPPAWVSRSGEAQPSATAPAVTPEELDAVVEIIEAQGWTIAADGSVSLIGADALAEPSAPAPTAHPGCS